MLRTVVRKLRQKMANKLLVNLCFALLLVVGIFAAGISRTDYSPLCRAISALLHYSLLAALLWMGAEAVNLYLTVVKLKTASSVQYLMLCVVVCWGMQMTGFCRHYSNYFLLFSRPSCRCCGNMPGFIFKRLRWNRIVSSKGVVSV